MSLQNVIEVKEVWKSFKTVQAVKGISLNIPKGQFVALLGPNGAGKTTLVEMIEGIRKPDSGEIRIMGKHWKGNEDELHRIIGLSLQETRFIDKLRVAETLQLFASFFNLGRERINEIIDIVGLEEKKRSYVVNLSGGQRQRLAIGIALINTPAILLLDEPTTGLDPNARREIWDILMKLKQMSETSMILTTHYMDEAEIIREPGVLLWGVVFPILMSLGLGLAFTRKADVIRKVAVIIPVTSAQTDTSPIFSFLNNKCEINTSLDVGEDDFKWRFEIKDDKLGNTEFLFYELEWDHAMVLLKRGTV